MIWGKSGKSTAVSQTKRTTAETKVAGTRVAEATSDATTDDHRGDSMGHTTGG